MSNDIQRKAAKGAAWMLAFKLCDRSLGIASTLILVRLLAPADFGIVAMAMAFIAMAELMAGFGFDLALIQNQRADRSHYDTAWTCNVALGVTVAVVLCALAEPIALFYGRPELFWVVIALACAPAVSGLENIGVVAFRKDLDFAREFGFLFAKRILSFGVTVPLAFMTRDYTALVAGVLVSRTIGVVLSYWVHPFRPGFSLSRAGELFKFSKWIVANSTVVFLRERASDFVIGRLHGAASLGLFNVGNELANLPLTEMAAPVNRALLPAFARLQDDLPAARSAFTNAIALLALIAIPASFGIAALAPQIVPVVLGAKWIDAVPLMELLAFSGGLVTFQSPVCAILVGRGRPDLVFRGHIVFVVVLLCALLGAPLAMGARGAAFALVAAAVVSTPVFFWLLRQQTGIGFLQTLSATVRPLIAAVVMFVAMRWSLPEIHASASTAHGAIVLLAGLVGGAATYASALALLWLGLGRPDGAERLVLTQIRRVLLRRQPMT